MNNNQRPLLDLFTNLRKAGFPLGVEEYKLLTESLANAESLGIKDRETLKKFCQSLLVKSAEDQVRFSAHFDQIFQPPREQKEHSEQPDIKKPIIRKPYLRRILIGILCLGMAGAMQVTWYRMCKSEEITKNQLYKLCFKKVEQEVEKAPIPIPSPEKDISETLKEDQEEKPKPTQQPVIIEIEKQPFWERELIFILSLIGLIMIIVNLILWWRDKQQEKARKPQILESKSKIIATLPPKLTPDYFPFPPRQMKQTWRYWRCLVRSGPPIELDMEKTVAEIGRQGVFLSPVLRPRAVNRTQLLLLMDLEGSMLPFRDYCHQLAQMALLENRLREQDIYYFRNCPQRYLFQDPAGRKPITIKRVLNTLSPQYGGILIISDGGAIRGTYSERRVKQTSAFLQQLRKVTVKIAWLNPLPPKRWKKTTAEMIAQEVSMFELNRQGLEQGINILRGKDQ
ncbi:MAG: hypothetical protein AB4058_02020 [Microcystaceae cyanobacterium]